MAKYEHPGFLHCTYCGNQFYQLVNTTYTPACCGALMVPYPVNAYPELMAGHEPLVEFTGGMLHVRIGMPPHEMTAQHHIAWICLSTDKGEQFRGLQLGEPAAAAFGLGMSRPVAVYAFCNLHGLWCKTFS